MINSWSPTIIGFKHRQYNFAMIMMAPMTGELQQ